MSYRIRKVESFNGVSKLNDNIFPGEPYEKHPYGSYWLIYHKGNPIGFSGLHPLVLTGEPDTVFLSRSGIYKKHRKKGLGGRLLDTRINFCRKNKYSHILTYTIDNVSSANNLISRGFRLYNPDYQYGGDEALYWILALS